jgi:hypothetical protein
VVGFGEEPFETVRDGIGEFHGVWSVTPREGG